MFFLIISAYLESYFDKMNISGIDAASSGDDDDNNDFPTNDFDVDDDAGDGINWAEHVEETDIREWQKFKGKHYSFGESILSEMSKLADESPAAHKEFMRGIQKLQRQVEMLRAATQYHVANQTDSASSLH